MEPRRYSTPGYCRKGCGSVLSKAYALPRKATAHTDNNQVLRSFTRRAFAQRIALGYLAARNGQRRTRRISAERVKTNAVRLLDQLKVPYQLREYEVDPTDLSAETVARKIGMPADQVFKTLVVFGDRNGVCLAVIPGDSELDLKALAKVSGDRKIELAPLKDLQPLTGYVRGGVTALACKKDYPVYVDETVILFEEISISAGVRGTQILLNPSDYLALTKATPGEIAKSKQRT